MDNYFTSVPLYSELRANNFGAVGTTRPHEDFPAELKQLKDRFSTNPTEMYRYRCRHMVFAKSPERAWWVRRKSSYEGFEKWEPEPPIPTLKISRHPIAPTLTPISVPCSNFNANLNPRLRQLTLDRTLKHNRRFLIRDLT